MSDPKTAGRQDQEFHAKEPGLCRLELTQLLMRGNYPSEQRLEYLLDRIEATSNMHTKFSPLSIYSQTPHPHALPTYDAKELTNGGVQAQISLNDKVYFLRITRAGKLILTK